MTQQILTVYGLIALGWLFYVLGSKDDFGREKILKFDKKASNDNSDKTIKSNDSDIKDPIKEILDPNFSSNSSKDIEKAN